LFLVQYIFLVAVVVDTILAALRVRAAVVAAVMVVLLGLQIVAAVVVVGIVIP
jgi:hypothetical protein